MVTPKENLVTTSAVERETTDDMAATSGEERGAEDHGTQMDSTDEQTEESIQFTLVFKGVKQNVIAPLDLPVLDFRKIVFEKTGMETDKGHST